MARKQAWKLQLEQSYVFGNESTIFSYAHDRVEMVTRILSRRRTTVARCQSTASFSLWL